tara:strand:- start:105 stop:1019 length:915 start_codon:yes stop_codon:yes gene_type:complete
MKTKIITKISEGLGNQLFMYANSYSLSKKNNFDFYIDSLSGYYQKKHNYMYLLDNFNITSKIASNNFVFNTGFKNFLKKILLIVDIFRKKKKFYFEPKKKNKITKFSPIIFDNNVDHIFLDGNFESEKYFSSFRKDLFKEFNIKNPNQFYDNKYLKIINNSNVISICIRQNRFSESIRNKNSENAINKSNHFVKQTVEYINKSIVFFENKVQNPIYLIWSNNFSGLENFFDSNKFIFVKNNDNKILTDFYLLTKCKYFIVGPSTFHWWGAWLSKYENKICVRPSNINLNPSNNIDYWPTNWISI